LQQHIDEDSRVRAAGGSYENPLDERIKRMEEELGIRFDPYAFALFMHKKIMLPLRGLDWDDSPVEQDWRLRDEEIPGTYVGGTEGVKGADPWAMQREEQARRESVKKAKEPEPFDPDDPWSQYVAR
jgi:hypothetical protein